MKNFIKYILVAVLAVSIMGCSKTQSNAINTLEKKELVVGLDDTFAPMGFKDSKGNLVGFDIDLAKEVGKRINKTMKFQPIDWSMKETELNAGNIDMIWNGFSINKERQEKMLFSDPYIDNKQIIVVLKDSAIKTKADLKNKAIATQKDSAAQDAIEQDAIVKEIKDQQPVLYPTFNDVFQDLDTKRSEAIVGDSVLVRYMIKQKNSDKYRILNDDFGQEQMGVGMRKNDTALKAEIDQALKALKADGTYDIIYAKWFK